MDKAEDKKGALVRVGKYEIKVPLCEKSKNECTEGNIYIGAHENQIVVIKVFLKEKAFLKEKEAYEVLQKYQNFPRGFPMVGVETIEKIQQNELSLEIKKKENVITMQYYQKSMLFHYIYWINKYKTRFSPLSPDTCRFFARKLISSIRNLDAVGLGHRDLKLQNILVDDSFQLKIFDFGHCAQSKDSNGQYIKYKVNPIKEPFGTYYYWTPESKEDREYTLIQYDLFSFAIILFFLYTRVPPFGQKKNSHNIDYELFLKDKKKFWKNKENEAGFKFQTDFKIMMNSFLSSNQAQRPTLDHLWPAQQKFEWFTGKESPEKQVQREMNTIYRSLKATTKFREREKIIQQHLEQFQLGEILKSKSRGKGSADFFETLGQLEIEIGNIEEAAQSEPYEFSEEFAKLALICFKDYLDYMDEQQDYEEEKWTLQTNEMGTQFELSKQDKSIRGIFLKSGEAKIGLELKETNMELLEEEMVHYEFKAILWNCFTIFP